ncbi:MAG: orotidine-5'-phosphate decarboxylase [Treponema sp.]|nr:orotidine-5'-phosphate decarboxylase [Treponema sp.]
MNTDRLYDAVASKGHVCIGLDTAADYIPLAERKKAKNDAEAVLAFNKSLIDATWDVCACFKVQIAYYEEMGISGLSAYSKTLSYIKDKGCLSIGDIKRADIADTASRYAKAHFKGEFEADFVTLNPYMGMDSIEPWLKEAAVLGKGAFVLMKTSNPGMRDFQYQEIAESADKNIKRVYDVLGSKMSSLAQKYRGKSGYGMFGVVVGCTEKDEAAEIRRAYPDLFFLIPGYGAQGGDAQTVALLLREGNGGVVNASRSIITAWQKEEGAGNADLSFAAGAARRAAVKMRDEIMGVIS